MILFTSAVAQELGDLPGKPVGIGLCDAMLGTAALLRQRRPALLVFVGTAGAFPGGPAIGAVVQAGTVILGDAALMLGLGYSPMHPELLATPPLPGIPSVVVLTQLAITTDPGLAARCGALAQVENMEAYGVARACARAGVPWACVLGVTNHVGPNAHAEWLANRAAAEERARSSARHAAQVPPRRELTG